MLNLKSWLGVATIGLMLATAPAAFAQQAAPAAEAAPATPRSVETGFLNRNITVNGVERPYVVYVPRNYTPDKKWPVILFLHGSGERGDDGLKQSQVGLGAALRMRSERYPAIAVFPQCAKDLRWDGEMADYALATLDRTLAEYSTDPDRVYLTGLSMGGSGSWLIASQHPEKFAAVASICGRGNPTEMAAKLKDLPVWVFVGDKDQEATVQNCRMMVKAIQEAGGTKVQYTEYPGVGHNSWDAAYDEAKFAEWLFAQRRTLPGNQ